MIKFRATSPKNGQIKVTAGKPSKVKGITGYRISYSLKKNMSGSKTITVTSKKNLSKIIKVRSGKKYWIQVSTIVTKNGKKYYGIMETKKAVKTK